MWDDTLGANHTYPVVGGVAQAGALGGHVVTTILALMLGITGEVLAPASRVALAGAQVGLDGAGGLAGHVLLCGKVSYVSQSIPQPRTFLDSLAESRREPIHASCSRLAIL